MYYLNSHPTMSQMSIVFQIMYSVTKENSYLAKELHPSFPFGSISSRLTLTMSMRKDIEVYTSPLRTV